MWARARSGRAQVADALATGQEAPAAVDRVEAVVNAAAAGTAALAFAHDEARGMLAVGAPRLAGLEFIESIDAIRSFQQRSETTVGIHMRE